MTKLCVNIDHVATVRQARKIAEPSPLEAAILCLKAGSVGITIHLREDRRHIQDHDLHALRRELNTMLNLEMAATEEMVGIALEQKPDQVTLVPEKRQEVTTEGGLDVVSNEVHLKTVVSRLQDAGIGVSMFIDPDSEQVKASHRIGAQLVELHTGCYADAIDEASRESALRALFEQSALTLELGMILNAGHGLNYENVKPVAAIEGMNELNIGHSIISRSLFTGIESAVVEMRKLIEEGTAQGPLSM